MAAQVPNGVHVPAHAGAQPAGPRPAPQIIYPPGEALQEHVYNNVIGILSITTTFPQQAQRRQNIWTMAGNIVSLARMNFGPDAEPKHVSIRCVHTNIPFPMGRVQVVLHRGGVHGDKLLVDAQVNQNTNLFEGFMREVNHVTLQAMDALRTRERMDEEALAAAIANEQF